MDRRILLPPIISFALVLALLTRPDITGFAVAGQSGQAGVSISANASVSIAEDGFVPDGSVVAVGLDDRTSSMDFGEFVGRTGADYSHAEGSMPGIGYEGYGYAGPYEYSLDISEFGLDTDVESGDHMLTINVSYDGFVFSSSLEKIVT